MLRTATVLISILLAVNISAAPLILDAPEHSLLSLISLDASIPQTSVLEAEQVTSELGLVPSLPAVDLVNGSLVYPHSLSSRLLDATDLKYQLSLDLVEWAVLSTPDTILATEILSASLESRDLKLQAGNLILLTNHRASLLI